MRLEQDKIIIEYRQEIDTIISMIDLYLKQGKVSESDRTELKDLSKKLDSLYISW